MTSSDYIIALLFSFFLSVIMTGLIQFVAKKLKVVDIPNSERKIHKKPIPLLGGLAIFFSFNLVVLFYALYTKDLIGGTIFLKNLFGIMIGTLFLAVGGFLDDKYNLRPRYQILFPILAVLVVIISGVGIDSITNPVGEGLWHLDKYVLNLFWYDGLLYKITLLADFFTFFWLLGMMYTTKLLDGLDGLVSGITLIGAVFMFFVALNKGDIVQYDVALIAILLIGVFLGFLVFNFNPASIFLGEGGSLYIGFMLGVLAIISGGKIATALLVMGIPILDVVWVILRRLFWDKKKITEADTKHLHFRLLDVGLSHRQAVLFLYFLTAVFGVTSLGLQTQGKLLAMGILALVMIVLAASLVLVYKNKIKKGFPN